MSSFLQVLIDGILSGLLYALVAAGLSMIWGVMDVINFAHGEFLMVAMYVCYWLGFILGLDPLFTWIASGIFLFIMGALTYKLVIKHSLGKAAMAPLLATFGLSMLLKNFCMNRFSPNFRLLSGTVLDGKTFEIGGAIVSVPQLVTGIFALVILAALYWLIKKTRLGWAIQATAMDKEAAELMGINTEKIYLLVFGIGGLAITYMLAPIIDSLLAKVNEKRVMAVCSVLMVLFAADAVYSQFHPNAGKGVTDIEAGAQPALPSDSGQTQNRAV